MDFVTDGLKKTFDAILAAGVPKDRIHSVKGSITDSEVQKSLINETVQKFGKIDVLINNAGGVKNDEKDQRSMASLDYCLEVNLKAIPFYCIAKAALDHFARNYAAILAPQGIRINNLNPGLTDTAGVKRSGASDEMIQKMRNFYISQIPFRRAAASEEMGEFILFMASEKASYMTGQCINVDGGMLINSPSIKFD
uniref:Uncharacterized protein n=1 Tax=Panagrolaimus superbus TaxID=310955 RepID=A0A914YQT2_9BILA